MAKLTLYGEEEQAKATTRSVLAHVLDQTMRMLHPFMPFITEEIWQHLPHQGESITVAEWPTHNASHHFPEALEDMETLKALIKSIRNTRSELNVPMSKQIELMIRPSNEAFAERLNRGRSYIEKFANPSDLQIATSLKTPEKAMSHALTGMELFLPLAGLLDLDAEVNRLDKEKEKLSKEVERIEKKLANQGFIAKAPANVVEEEKSKKQDYEAKRQSVIDRIAELKA